MPSLGITWAQQHRECIDEDADGFCHVPGKQEKCCLRQMIHRAIWKPLSSCPVSRRVCWKHYFGLDFSCDSENRGSLSNNSCWTSWGGFLPPKLIGRRGWIRRLQFNVARALQFAGFYLEAVCWMGTLDSKQLGLGCHNANYPLELWCWATDTLRCPKIRKQCSSWQPHTHTYTHSHPVYELQVKPAVAPSSNSVLRLNILNLTEVTLEVQMEPMELPHCSLNVLPIFSFV